MPTPVAPARTVRVPGSRPPPRRSSSPSIPNPCRGFAIRLSRLLPGAVADHAGRSTILGSSGRGRDKPVRPFESSRRRRIAELSHHNPHNPRDRHDRHDRTGRGRHARRHDGRFNPSARPTSGSVSLQTRKCPVCDEPETPTGTAARGACLGGPFAVSCWRRWPIPGSASPRPPATRRRRRRPAPGIPAAPAPGRSRRRPAIRGGVMTPARPGRPRQRPMPGPRRSRPARPPTPRSSTRSPRRPAPAPARPLRPTRRRPRRDEFPAIVPVDPEPGTRPAEPAPGQVLDLKRDTTGLIPDAPPAPAASGRPARSPPTSTG